MKKNIIQTEVFEYESINELSKEEIFLIEKARDSAIQAYAPYSNFKVGVSILLANNTIINGNNQENAAYPSGLCAERVALYYANSKYPDTIVKAIAVCAFTDNNFIDIPVPPCGSCRQSLLETENRYNSPIKMILAGKEKIFIVHSIKELLPLNFTGDFIHNSNT